MTAITATERPTTTAAAAASKSLMMRQLILSLSMSASSKVIVKQQHGGGAFRCKTCGRSFATFQALGGHRTSHKRPLVRAHGLDLLLGARPGKGSAAAGDVHEHRCGTCGAVFPTGQALGGHMRRHRAAVVAALDDVEHGESATAARVVRSHALSSSGEHHHQGDENKDDDMMREVRLIKFI